MRISRRLVPRPPVPRRLLPRAVLSLVLGSAGLAAAGELAAPPPAASASTYLAGTALVANWGSNSVTPIDTQTNTAMSPIGVGSNPDAIAVAPNGQTAYVANWGSNTVTPIDIATGKAEPTIRVGKHPDAIAIAPDGAVAYVANFGASSVTAIDLQTGKVEATIAVRPHPNAVAVSPSNEVAYVTSETDGTASVISVEANKLDTTIFTGPDPVAVAVSSDSSTAYFVNLSRDQVTPVGYPSGIAASAIGVGTFPRDIAMSPDGTTAYVADFGSDDIEAIGTAEGRSGAPVTVGADPMGLAVTPDDSTVYVADSGSNEVTPIAVSNLSPGTPIAVGSAPDAVAIVPSWNDQSFVTWSGGGAQSDDSIAMAYFEGDLYALWTDALSGDEVMWSRFDGTTWSVEQQVSFSGGAALSHQGPSVAVVGGQLYAVWSGAGTGAVDVWYSTFNGTAWSSQARLSWGAGHFAQTKVAPVITEEIGFPVVAWTTPTDEVEYSDQTGLTSWSKPLVLSGPKGTVETVFSPALTWSSVIDSIVFAWTNTNGTVGFLPEDDPALEGTVPSALTVSAPAIATTGEAFYVAWQGKTGNRIFYSGVWPDFTGWSHWAPQETEPQALTGLKPALATTGAYVTLGWKGATATSIGFASALSPY